MSSSGFYTALGAMVGVYLIGILIYIILDIIASWKIFTKAGEPGWKSIIPIYNSYILFKISGIKNLFWALLIIGFAMGLFNGGDAPTIITSLLTLAMIVINVFLNIKLADSFGKGGGFKIGLIFLPTIFKMILAFGSSTYVGNAQQ